MGRKSTPSASFRVPCYSTREIQLLFGTVALCQQLLIATYNGRTSLCRIVIFPKPHPTSLFKKPRVSVYLSILAEYKPSSIA